jgi:transposase-like protein
MAGSRAHVEKAVSLYIDCNRNVSETARRMGIRRQTLHKYLDQAESWGLLNGDRLRKSPNPSRFTDIRGRRLREYAEVKAEGTFRTPHVVHLPDDKPFCLVMLGDPHFDNPGTDLELWERWTAPLNRRAGVYGICLGDYLDNWLRALGHLYGGAQTTVDDAWHLLTGYLNQMGNNLLASVSGNHDDWGETKALQMLMEQNGVVHRKRGLRLDLRTPGGHSVTIGLRHRFAGNSQWNPAHAVIKAAQLGWRDDILAGGDKHISGVGYHKDAESGRITHCLQVAAFKIMDDYAEEKGFLDKHITPAVALVVDPCKAPTDPARITHFLEPQAAADYTAMLRGRAVKPKGGAKARRV